PAELLAGLGQPTGHRSFAPAEYLGHFGLRLPLQAAENERHAVLLRQPIDLTVENGLPFPQCPLHDRVLAASALNPAPFFALARLDSPGVHGGPVCDRVEPARYGRGLSDRAGPGREDQKCRLERVVDVLLMAENVPANRAHEPRVPADEGCERVRGALGG